MRLRLCLSSCVLVLCQFIFSDTSNSRIELDFNDNLRLLDGIRKATFHLLWVPLDIICQFLKFEDSLQCLLNEKQDSLGSAREFCEDLESEDIKRIEQLKNLVKKSVEICHQSVIFHFIMSHIQLFHIFLQSGLITRCIHGK